MNLPIRKNLRIKDFDYKSENIYFVTICSKNQECIFCNIDDEITNVNFDVIDFNNCIHYSNIGMIIVKALESIETIYIGVKLKEYVIMPNHLHLLIQITDEIENNANDIDISKIIGSFKRFVTQLVNKGNKQKIVVWQKSFYEHIVRNEKDYNRILEYIIYNPYRWKLDEYYR